MQLGHCHTKPLGLYGFSVFQFFRFLPTSKIERHRHAGVAQFIRNRAVDHGAGHDHASDAQSSYGACGGWARPAILDGAALKDTDHRLEDGLEGALGAFAATRDIARQSEHGTGVLDVLKMLAGEVGADHLRPYVSGSQIHFHTFPATLPIRVGKEAPKHLGIEIALAFEIAIESTVRQARAPAMI